MSLVDYQWRWQLVLTSRPPEMAADAVAALGCADVRTSGSEAQAGKALRRIHPEHEHYVERMWIRWCKRPSLVQMAYGREQPVCFLAMFMGR